MDRSITGKTLPAFELMVKSRPLNSGQHRRLAVLLAVFPTKKALPQACHPERMGSRLGGALSSQIRQTSRELERSFAFTEDDAVFCDYWILINTNLARLLPAD